MHVMKKILFIFGLVIATASFGNSNCLTAEQILELMPAVSSDIDGYIVEIDMFLQKPNVVPFEVLMNSLIYFKTQFENIRDSLIDVKAQLLAVGNASVDIEAIETKCLNSLIEFHDLQIRFVKRRRIIIDLFGN